MITDKAHDAIRVYNIARERAIKGQVGMTFRGSVAVHIRKPRWMPERVYRWLMRTIVVIETGPEIEVVEQ